MAKMHVSLNVADVARSVAFYRSFFGVEPVKLKADYAKFDVAEPAVNFTLNQRPVAPGEALSHLGIQVDSTEQVLAAKARLQEAGLILEDEMSTVCCYALQDKVWATDPDGHRWEVFHVMVGDVEADSVQGGDCCVPVEDEAAEACCTPEVKQEAVAAGRGCC